VTSEGGAGAFKVWLATSKEQICQSMSANGRRITGGAC